MKNTFEALRKKYSQFSFENIQWEEKEGLLMVVFHFNLSGKHDFYPKIKFPHPKQFGKTVEELQPFFFHIGMIELVSYWKATCAPSIVIKTGYLSEEQIAWWKKLYFYGLGEFFYTNGIETSLEDFVQIKIESEEQHPFVHNGQLKGNLIPIGGGKDSVVSLELLKDYKADNTPFIINPRGASWESALRGGYKETDIFVLKRFLDKHLLELNAEGYLNGHTPFSAMLAFVSLMVAHLLDKKYIALSNESSANEPTVLGTKVNHQYSKSFEFEKDFNEYIKEHLSNIHYFSLLRPLNEYQIASLFAQNPKYFEVFKSCNVGSKQNKWCCNCPKCLFVYIMLVPHLNEATLFSIFSKNLLDRKSLRHTLEELIGAAEQKPFECVGSVEEVRVALTQAVGEYQDNLPYLLQYFVDNYPQLLVGEDEIVKIQTEINREHLLPRKYQQIVYGRFQNAFRKKIDNQFKYKKVCLLGFGREGKSTFKLLNKWEVKADLVIADLNEKVSQDFEEMPTDLKVNSLDFQLGTSYLEDLDRFDYIIKSPGVNLNGVEVDMEKVVSQTSLFLEHYRHQVIGITGTKGKSTTTSLIHHLIKEAGLPTVLLGNIGIPAFDVLEEIQADTWAVMELSSYQLEHLSVSPHIAVLLNLYQEHLDRHQTYELYQAAKFNIYQHQQEGDVLIWNREHPLLQEKVKTNKQSVFTYTTQTDSVANVFVEKQKVYFKSRSKQEEPVFIFNTKLKRNILGAHNFSNILAASTLGKVLEIESKTIEKGIGSFKGLPHRLEYVGEVKAKHFYNDSIATIPEACMQAVNALGGVDCLIMGGKDRGIDYTELVAFVLEKKIASVVVLGEVGKRLENDLKAIPNLLVSKDFEKAVAFAIAQTPKGGKCLLSPAASSYDMFANFVERGNRFKELVLL